MKKMLLSVLIVAMLFAMSPLLVFADSDQNQGSWEQYKTQYGSLLNTYAKVNPKHANFADFAVEINEVKLGIEALFGISFAVNPEENEEGVGGLIGESAAADADLVATDSDAEAYPITSRDIHDVFTSAYNQLYVNSLGGITIRGYSIGVQEGRVAQWNSIKELWNSRVLSIVTGGGLDTPEQAVEDAEEVYEIHVPYGECTNNSTSHRRSVLGISKHTLRIGCTFETRSEFVPTGRALLLTSTGIADIAKSYIDEQLEYEEAYANITEKNAATNAATITLLAINDEEKVVADQFIASAEEYAARYKEVLIPEAKTGLDNKISSLGSRLDAASKVTFPEDDPITELPEITVPKPEIEKPEIIVKKPEIDKPEIVVPEPEIDKPEIVVPEIDKPEVKSSEFDTPVSNAVDSPISSAIEPIIAQDETLTLSSNPLPLVGFVPGEIITENPEVTLVPSETPKSMSSPESTYSPLWIWGLTADLFAFVVVFLIILWRRKQRINEGEDIF
jgi:hypothetical protein